VLHKCGHTNSHRHVYRDFTILPNPAHGLGVRNPVSVPLLSIFGLIQGNRLKSENKQTLKEVLIVRGLTQNILLVEAMNAQSQWKS